MVANVGIPRLVWDLRCTVHNAWYAVAADCLGKSDGLVSGEVALNPGLTAAAAATAAPSPPSMPTTADARHTASAAALGSAGHIAIVTAGATSTPLRAAIDSSAHDVTSPATTPLLAFAAGAAVAEDYAKTVHDPSTAAAAAALPPHKDIKIKSNCQRAPLASVAATYCHMH